MGRSAERKGVRRERTLRINVVGQVKEEGGGAGRADRRRVNPALRVRFYCGQSWTRLGRGNMWVLIRGAS